MVCDIHLRLERKLKKDKVWNEYYTEKAGEWENCYIFDSGYTWRDRIYGMFALLADVRNYHNLDHIPLRGLPDDCCDSTLSCYGYRVSDIIKDEYHDWEVSRKDADSWVVQGLSKYYTINGVEYVSCPDWHSPNWCTTQEMEDCINKLFKKEDGTYEGDYIEWLALLGAMKGYEASGEYKCRAVFWFDN